MQICMNQNIYARTFPAMQYLRTPNWKKIVKCMAIDKSFIFMQ